METLLKLDRPLAVFDIESTGIMPTRDRIVEIGAMRVECDGTMSRFTTLVNPGIPIPVRAQSVHGITDEMVANAPSFKDAAYQFLEFIEGSKLVSHNARFDLGFMQENLARTGLPLIKTGAYDSIQLIRKAFPRLPSYSLQSLRVTLHLPEVEGDAHRAMFDAELTMYAFSYAMKQLYDLYPQQAE